MPVLALGPTARLLGVRRFARLRRRPEARRRVPPAPQCGLLAAFFRKVGAARPRSLSLSLPEVGATCGCISAKRVSLPQQLLPTDSDSLFSMHKMNWEEGTMSTTAPILDSAKLRYRRGAGFSASGCHTHQKGRCANRCGSA